MCKNYFPVIGRHFLCFACRYQTFPFGQMNEDFLQRLFINQPLTNEWYHLSLLLIFCVDLMQWNNWQEKRTSLIHICACVKLRWCSGCSVSIIIDHFLMKKKELLWSKHCMGFFLCCSTSVTNSTHTKLFNIQNIERMPNTKFYTSNLHENVKATQGGFVMCTKLWLNVI